MARRRRPRVECVLQIGHNGAAAALAGKRLEVEALSSGGVLHAPKIVFERHRAAGDVPDHLAASQPPGGFFRPCPGAPLPPRGNMRYRYAFAAS